MMVSLNIVEAKALVEVAEGQVERLQQTLADFGERCTAKYVKATNRTITNAESGIAAIKDCIKTVGGQRQK